jgi:hypothetical protein
MIDANPSKKNITIYKKSKNAKIKCHNDLDRLAKFDERNKIHFDCDELLIKFDLSVNQK